MYEELCKQLNLFAHDHNLRITIHTTTDEAAFLFQNKERTWGYQRVFSIEELTLTAMEPYQYANMVVNDVRNRLSSKGLI